MKQDKQEVQINELLRQMTIEEKIGMIHGAGLFRTEGVERLDIPPVCMSDGPMGVRAEFADAEWRSIGTTEDFTSYLPCNSAIASTWNKELAGKAGRVLGEEARGRGKDVILAPGINIKRSPLCGRNFEYMSEDPRLIEEMAVPLIKGIQENDVAACAKHFAANGQETERLWVDTIVDERTLQEIYYPGFRAAVEKGGIFSLMGAYNRLNGEHCCTGKKLLNEVLREQWKYDGTVISDWGGVHDTVLAAESGLDIEMNVKYEFHEQYMADALLEKVRAGEIAEALVDEKVRNILRMMLRLHMIGDGKEQRKTGTYNTKEHQEALLDAARESVILLKNEGGALPLGGQNGKRVAVIGQNGAAVHSNGGGSAEIKALYEISPLMGIQKLLGGNVKVSYAPGYYIPKGESTELNWQANSLEKQVENDSVGKDKVSSEQKAKNEELKKEALLLARECDTVIFVGGLNHDYDVEGKDRADMRLPYGQDELIEELLSERPDTIIVLYAGSPVEMPWADRAKAILWSYYAGMEGGTAIAEILFGKVNPSGKTAETFIRNVSQCPAHTIGTFGKEDCVEYKEGIMIGYRYYDTENTDVLYCFGHGLSYTDFVYSDLKIQSAEKGMADREQVLCEISLKVKNTGGMDGKETVQLYVAPKETAVERPAHELKAFQKIALKAGETGNVLFRLGKKDFSYYSQDAQDFVLAKGEYELQAAGSSRDIRLVGNFVVE